MYIRTYIYPPFFLRPNLGSKKKGYKVMSENYNDRLDETLDLVKYIGVKVKKNFDPKKHREALESAVKVTLCAGKTSWRGEAHIIALGGNEYQKQSAMHVLSTILQSSGVKVLRKRESMHVSFAQNQNRTFARIVG